MTRLLLVLLVAGALGYCALGYCEYLNSREVPPPASSELKDRFEHAAAWILERRDQVLADDTPMLWLFVREAGRLSGDSRLLGLAAEYQARHSGVWAWAFLFNARGGAHPLDPPLSVPQSLPGYQRLLLYGATCSATEREDPEVLALLTPSACDAGLKWLRTPWCRSRQLLGLDLVQQNRCEAGAETDRTIHTVQDRLLTELRWDFRVEDPYMQKVLMLVASGRRRDVRAIWLRRILDAQQPDGGWNGVDVIAHLPDGKLLCFSPDQLYPVVLSDPSSTFHATAQGLYLLALLLASGSVSSGPVP